MKLILFILLSKFEVIEFNGMPNFILFKFLKNMLILISYTLLNILTLDFDISFKMDNIFIMYLSN
jgi:hypothetical protein